MKTKVVRSICRLRRCMKPIRMNYSKKILGPILLSFIKQMFWYRSRKTIPTNGVKPRNKHCHAEPIFHPSSGMLLPNQFQDPCLHFSAHQWTWGETCVKSTLTPHAVIPWSMWIHPSKRGWNSTGWSRSRRSNMVSTLGTWFTNSSTTEPWH